MWALAAVAGGLALALVVACPAPMAPLFPASALVVWRRQRPFKLAANITAFLLEAAIAVVVLRTLVGTTPAAVDVRLWAALAAALLAGLVVSGLTLAAAIACFDGPFAERARREVVHATLFYVPGAVLGASATAPYLVEPWLGLAFTVPVPLVWLVQRSHGALMHRFADLSQIHAFSSQVGRSAQLQEIVDTAVHEIAGHLRATTVALAVYDPGAKVAAAPSS